MTDDDPGIGAWTNDVHAGDSADVLASMPESSVHMSMCSPPYFGLRDYDVDGQIGREETLAEYVQNLVDVGRELRRVLRPDGSWWLNLGDSYVTSAPGNPGAHRDFDGGTTTAEVAAAQVTDRTDASDMPQKCKMMVPHRVAMALVDDGWILRNDAVWRKPGGGMPEAVTDRLTTTFEYVFHLVPQGDYWYDLDAIREPYKSDRTYRGGSATGNDGPRSRDLPTNSKFGSPEGKNPGDVFDVSLKPFPDAHFAVYPPELCKKPILATCPPRVCPECGTPHDRVVDRESEYINDNSPDESGVSDVRNDVDGDEHDIRRGVVTTATHQGWEPGCDCGTDDWQPGIALDPFAGAGTTCLVAKRHNRRFVGIDLNPEFVAMAQQRIGIPVDDPELVGDEDQPPLGDYLDGE